MDLGRPRAKHLVSHGASVVAKQEDDGGENDNNDDGNDFDVIEGGELSFDYRANKQGPYIVSTSTNTAEVGNLYYSKLEWFLKPGCILNFILIAHLLFYLKYYQTLT